MHLIFQCSYAKEVWYAIGQYFHINWCDSNEIVDFLHIWRTADIGDSKLALFPMLVIWFIWVAINDHKYQILDTVPSTSISHILAYFTMACRTFGFSGNSANPRVGRMATLTKWQPPPIGWIKVNFDGSWVSSAAGAGGVFRDHLGKCLCFFNSPIVASSPLEAEYWGFLLSFRVSISCKFSQLLLETDSLTIYKDFGLTNMSKWNVLGIWNRIKTLSEKYNLSIVLSHVFQEGNSPADWLAKPGKVLGNLIVDVSPPHHLKRLLHSDSLDFPFVRR
ncbi:uncharacterized protein LOC110038251 [Phalaenopsis equestris]|uniref:uncharacterized protein LOC110038251 n=1 Tax=Phalaenopsis equestris TaxID=78828 RepID=UPI0009E6483A|nr:uncharacterized protein LOC110038251 [Phalaenopsis equestris]